MLLDEVIDGGLEVDDGAEGALFEAAAGELGEKALDGVKPRPGGRHEVEGLTRMPREPSADLRLLVGGVVVEDDVNGFVREQFGFDGVQEADELLVPVLLHVALDHRAVEHVQRRERRRRAVALVVVRHGRPSTALERQPRLRAIERLNLALLVH